MATQQITRLNSTVSSIPVCRHDVHFYETDSALGEELARHIGPALERGDTTIVIATKSHCGKSCGCAELTLKLQLKQRNT
jgi:hypothetical protein